MDGLVVTVAVGVVWLTEGKQCPNQVYVRLMKDSRDVGPFATTSPQPSTPATGQSYVSDPNYAQGGLSSLQQKLQMSVP